jgi:hypothetical protein
VAVFFQFIRVRIRKNGQSRGRPLRHYGPFFPFDRQVAGFTQDQVEGFPVQFRIPLVVAELIHTQLFVERKFHIPSISQYLCHGSFLSEVRYCLFASWAGWPVYGLQAKSA